MLTGALDNPLGDGRCAETAVLGRCAQRRGCGRGGVRCKSKAASWREVDVALLKANMDPGSNATLRDCFPLYKPVVFGEGHVFLFILTGTHSHWKARPWDALPRFDSVRSISMQMAPEEKNRSRYALLSFVV